MMLLVLLVAAVWGVVVLVYAAVQRPRTPFVVGALVGVVLGVPLGAAGLTAAMGPIGKPSAAFFALLLGGGLGLLVGPPVGLLLVSLLCGPRSRGQGTLVGVLLGLLSGALLLTLLPDGWSETPSLAMGVAFVPSALLLGLAGGHLGGRWDELAGDTQRRLNWLAAALALVLLAVGGLRERSIRCHAFSVAQLSEAGDVRALLIKLQSADRNVAGRAAWALGTVGAKDAEVITALMDKAASPEWWTARAAADALGQLGDRRAVPVLVKALGTKDYLQRASVAKALGQLGGAEAAQALRSAVNDPAPQVRQAVALALTKLGDPAGEAALRDVAVNTGSPEATAALKGSPAAEGLLPDQPLRTFGSAGGGQVRLALTADGATLVVAQTYEPQGHNVALYELSTGKLRRTLSWGRAALHCGDVAVTPDGSRVAAASWDKQGEIVVWDATSGEVLKRWPSGHSGWPSGLAFAPDGRTLGSAGGHDVRLWTVADGSAQRVLTMPGSSDARDVVFAPDGASVAAAGQPQAAIWRVADGAQQYAHPNMQAHSLAYLPDGSRLATGSLHGGLAVWNPATSTSERILKTSENADVAIAVSPGGRVLATGVVGYYVKLWDWRNSRLVATLRCSHNARLSGTNIGVHALLFTPDGQQLVTGNDSGTVALWQLEPALSKALGQSDKAGPVPPTAAEAAATDRQQRIGRLLEEARAASKRGDLAGAEAKYRELLTVSPNGRVTHFELAFCLANQHRNAEAMQEFRWVKAQPECTASEREWCDKMIRRLRG